MGRIHLHEGMRRQDAAETDRRSKEDEIGFIGGGGVGTGPPCRFRIFAVERSV